MDVPYAQIVIFPGVLCAVKCRYNAVQYNMILHTVLKWLRQNVNQDLYSQHTSHISPSPASFWVVYCEEFGENWVPYNGTALYQDSMAYGFDGSM